MTHVAKIIEIVGSSDKSWQDAAQAALEETKKTVHGITGVEVGDMTAKVDPTNGNITEFQDSVWCGALDLTTDSAQSFYS